MQKPRHSSLDRFILAVGIVLFLIGISLALASCATHRAPSKAIGPDRSLYKHQPKFQP